MEAQILSTRARLLLVSTTSGYFALVSIAWSGMWSQVLSVTGFWMR